MQTKVIPILLIAVFAIHCNCIKNKKINSTELPRLIITSDINNVGGDPDDKQSMAHLLMYANEVEITAIIPDYWRGKGIDATNQAIDAYADDYLNRSYNFQKMNYPNPDSIRSKIAQNREDAIKRIIYEAKKQDKRPLYILVWGSMQTIKAALFKAPEITDKLRVLTIATNVMAQNTDSKTNAKVEKYCEHINWNGRGRNDIFNDTRFKNLWWIENDWAYNGMFEGQEPRDLLLEIKNYGNLGFHIWEVVQVKAWAHYFRAGDTPTLLYLLESINHDNPTESTWAGSFTQPFPNERPNYWTDDAETETWDYTNPCNSWNLAEEVYQKRINRFVANRDGVYKAFREKLEKLYNQ